MPLSLGCRLICLSLSCPPFVLRHLFPAGPAACVPHFHLPSTCGGLALSTSAFTLVRFFAHAFLLHSKPIHLQHSNCGSHSFPASPLAVASRHDRPSIVIIKIASSEAELCNITPRMEIEDSILDPERTRSKNGTACGAGAKYKHHRFPPRQQPDSHAPCIHPLI